MTVTTGRAQSPPTFPPGHDRQEILRDCYHNVFDRLDSYGTDYRRSITLTSPTLFAITYFGPMLRDAMTGEMSFNDLHMDLHDLGRKWVRPGASRDAVVAPREAGKSMWLNVILPAWALGHGHRKFFLTVSNTREQATGQLADLRSALVRFPLIQRDYPELRYRTGHGSRNASHMVTAGGATLAARGIGEKTRGLRGMENRPDLIVLDDMEPGEADYTPQARGKILSRIQNDILPMNTRAAVVLTGTVTTPGSIMHDVVRSAKGRPGLGPDRGRWVNDDGYETHYWPAVLNGADGTRRSLWPSRWSLEELDAMRVDAHGNERRDYQCNYDNDPTENAGAVWWRPESYSYARDMGLTRRVLSIDGAVKRGKKNDQTAIVVGGTAADPRRIIVEHAEQGRITGVQLRERVWEYWRLYRSTLREVLVEVNQGGDRWADVLSPLPPGVELIEYHVTGRKQMRIEVLHRHYQRNAIYHATRLPELEDQQCDWNPMATADDLLDAESAMVRHLLDGSPEG